MKKLRTRYEMKSLRKIKGLIYFSCVIEQNKSTAKNR